MAVIVSPIHSPIRSPIRGPLDGKWGADPLGAWLSGAVYADYDARKLDRLFQDSTGQTAVASSGDKAGLWLDGAQFGTKTLAQVIAGQAEICTGGTFDSATGWTLQSGVTISGGKLQLAVASTGLNYFIVPTQPAGFYRFEFTVDSRSAGDCILRPLNGGAQVALSINAYVSTAKTQVVYAYCSGSWDRIAVQTGGAGFTGVVDNVSVKAIPGNHGLQATANSRLNYLVAGSRITLTADALDDNLLSSYLAGAGANSILVDVDVPATVSASQVVIGMSGSATARLSLGINTSGQLCAGVGNDANTTIVGTTDWRGQRLIAALSADGSTVKLLTANGEEYSAAQNGSPTTTIPASLAANNNNGTGSSFLGGGIARAITAQKAMDLATFNAIRAQLLAS
jgi:hypothetical protein